jgi:hypothetical protein
VRAARRAASFYLVNLDATGFADVELRYRQPMSRLCLATDMAAPSVSLAPVLAPPEPDCTDHGARTWTDALYDVNSNGRVTLQEFEEGLYSLVCCGEACPFDSDCRQQASVIGLQESAANYVPTDQIFASIVNANETSWVPGCHSRARFTQAAPSATAVASGTYSIGTIFSAWGEIAVTLQQDPHRAVSRADGSILYAANQTTSAPGKLHGYNMLWSDVELVKNAYGADFAAPDANENAFILFHVGCGAGNARSNWLYVSNPIYAYIYPSLLRFLTLDLLVPLVDSHTIHFLDNSCHFDAADHDETMRNQTLAIVHDSLLKALTAYQSSNVPELRGALLYVPPDGFSTLGFVAKQRANAGPDCRPWGVDLMVLRSHSRSAAKSAFLPSGR